MPFKRRFKNISQADAEAASSSPALVLKQEFVGTKNKNQETGKGHHLITSRKMGSVKFLIIFLLIGLMYEMGKLHQIERLELTAEIPSLEKNDAEPHRYEGLIASNKEDHLHANETKLRGSSSSHPSITSNDLKQERQQSGDALLSPGPVQNDESNKSNKEDHLHANETKLRGSSSSHPSITSNDLKQERQQSRDALLSPGPLQNDESEHLISRQNVMSVLKKMHSGNLINRGYLVHLLTKSKELLHSIDSVYDVAYPNNDDPSSDPKVTVVGDIHGQFTTMLHIFQVNGFPSRNHVYIFNGDYVDKGHTSVQVLIALLLFKLHCPECIHFTRGNHEARMFLKGRVRKQTIRQYDEEVYNLMVEVINEIPVAIILGHKVLFIHAGIDSPDLTIDKMKAIPKGVDSEDHDLMSNLVWADPKDEDGLTESSAGLEFGPDISKAFLERNNLDRIVRGHTSVHDGFADQHDGRVITIWSAPTEGRGSYANFDSSLVLHVEHFDAFPKFSEIEDWSVL